MPAGHRGPTDKLRQLGPELADVVHGFVADNHLHRRRKAQPPEGHRLRLRENLQSPARAHEPGDQSHARPEAHPHIPAQKVAERIEVFAGRASFDLQTGEELRQEIVRAASKFACLRSPIPINTIHFFTRSKPSQTISFHLFIYVYIYKSSQFG